MNSSDQLESLLAISRINYDHQRQTFAKILQEEAQLRQELVRLAEMGQAGRQNDVNAISMRAIGADLLWKSWLGRSRSELNMKLARVLATKEQEQEKVRRAFGKVNALEELVLSGRVKQRKTDARRDLELAINNALSCDPGR